MLLSRYHGDFDAASAAVVAALVSATVATPLPSYSLSFIPLFRARPCLSAISRRPSQLRRHHELRLSSRRRITSSLTPRCLLSRYTSREKQANFHSCLFSSRHHRDLPRFTTHIKTVCIWQFAMAMIHFHRQRAHVSLHHCVTACVAALVPSSPHHRALCPSQPMLSSLHTFL